jgi:hypothetical protein
MALYRPRTAVASAALMAVLGVGQSAVQALEATDLPAAALAPGRGLGMLEGSVTEVNAATGTVKVELGRPGMPGRTLEVGDRTLIEVDGRRGTLADLQEGAKVKASYEIRGGTDVATRIEVTGADQCGRPGEVLSRRGTASDARTQSDSRVASTQLLQQCVRNPVR